MDAVEASHPVAGPYPSTVPVTDLSGVEAIALLDTGSSVSGVASHLAIRLELAGLGKRPLTSAQGIGQVQRFAFRVAFDAVADHDQAGIATATPTFPFVFDEVIGIELTNTFEFTALIGMDILQRCDFTTSATGIVA